MPKLNPQRFFLACLILATCGCGPQDTSNQVAPFDGDIETSIRDSSPDFLPVITHNTQRPNIILIVADDLGYSDPGVYGGEIETPNLDALAARGAHYSHFTVTSVCSSTRAALLTGLNHHSVGTGWLAEWDFGYPGYRGEMTRQSMTLPEILNEHNYATYMVGKWHLTNARNRSRIGPFDSWPLGRGFQRYWGFLDGEASQFKPHAIVSDNTVMPPPEDEDFYLPDAMTNKAIEMIDDLRAHEARQPFFLYYATGAPHAPHHTKPEDREKYLGKYDHGWDVARQQRLARMKSSGLVPDSTQLAPYTPGVVPWETLSADQKKMYSRLEENFAAFVDNMDQNIGRLLDHVERIGETDNTVVIFVSDNGGSREVGIEGASNALRFFHKRPSTTAQNLKDYDRVGDITTHPHYPLGWMQVSNTPFIHSKRTTHDGGSRVPMIIAWPGRIQQPGVRHQFHHANDIVPTILEGLQIDLPETYQGRQIKPVEGTSLLYSLEDPDAEDLKTEQYYEMEGNRAYYKDGWKIISHREEQQSVKDTEWELYNLKQDFSASNNLARSHPDKVEELEELWWEAAETHQVLPIIDLPLLERPMHTRVWLDKGPDSFTYRPGVNTIHRFKGPVLPNKSFIIRARLSRTDAKQEGVLAALGDYYSGYSFFIKDNHLYYEINTAHNVTRIKSSIPVPVGSSTLEYRFEKVNMAMAVAKGLFSDGLDFDKMSVLKGTGSLWINNRKVGEAHLEQPVFAVWEGLDIGRDALTPVSSMYQAPFEFQGELENVSWLLD
jgi:arylsulfatase